MTEGANERERTRYTAGQIAELVRAGRLFGLPTDTSAIHKLARQERWDYIKQKVEGQKGAAPHFYRVPARYFDASADEPVPGRRRARIKAPLRLPGLTDKVRLLHLTATETINGCLPGLNARDRQRYIMTYLLVCRLLEKGTDEKFIVQTIVEMAQIGAADTGNSSPDEQT